MPFPSDVATEMPARPDQTMCDLSGDHAAWSLSPARSISLRASLPSGEASKMLRYAELTRVKAMSPVRPGTGVAEGLADGAVAGDSAGGGTTVSWLGGCCDPTYRPAASSAA